MTRHQHWSEYLLPIPTTVAMVSMLMVISAQFTSVITLQKPSSGRFEHLKYDTLAPNIEKLKNLMIEAFEDSDEAMLRINTNSQWINTQLKKSVEYAGLAQNSSSALSTKKKLISFSLKMIKKWADENIEKEYENVFEKFNNCFSFYILSI